eukprot:5997136-Prorocentrum_lima.AAC.1
MTIADPWRPGVDTFSAAMNAWRCCTLFPIFSKYWSYPRECSRDTTACATLKQATTEREKHMSHM